VPDLLGPLHRSGSKCEDQVLATFFSWAHRFGNAAIFGPYSIHRITFTIPIKYLLFSVNAGFFFQNELPTMPGWYQFSLRNCGGEGFLNN
jgi:hypothetical protein